MKGKNDNRTYIRSNRSYQVGGCIQTASLHEGDNFSFSSLLHERNFSLLGMMEPDPL